VKYLEQCSVKLDLLRIDPNFVWRIMMEIGITLPRLLNIYDQLYRRRVSGKQALVIQTLNAVCCSAMKVVESLTVSFGIVRF
jgi:hypothetical protein